MESKCSVRVALIVGVLTAVTLAASGCCTGFKTFYCPPDNEPVQVLKNPEQAYPVYAKSYKVSVEATKEAADGAKSRYGAGIESAVVTLRTELDQESSQVQDILKAAVLGLQMTPCDKESRREFSTLIEKVNERGVQIAKFRALMQAAVASGDTTAVKESVAATSTFFHAAPFR